MSALGAPLSRPRVHLSTDSTLVQAGRGGAHRRRDTVIVDPGEFVPARDASRKLGELIDRLEAGQLAKAVIVDRNRPRAVVLTVLGL